jgi:hypothetical protein
VRAGGVRSVSRTYTTSGTVGGTVSGTSKTSSAVGGVSTVLSSTVSTSAGGVASSANVVTVYTRVCGIGSVRGMRTSGVV